MRTGSEPDSREIELQLLRSQARAPESSLAGVLVLLLLLFIAPLLAATYWMQVQAERELTRAELERNLVQARTLAALLEREFVSAQQLLSSIADRHLFRRAWRERDPRALERHLREAHELEPTFLFVSVCEPNGTLRAIFPPDPIVGQNFAYRDWYRGVTAHGQPYVSEAYHTAAGSNPFVVALAIPIRDEQGKSIGILMAVYVLNQLSHRFKGLEAGARGVSCMIDQRGVVVASTGVDALGERLQGPEQDAVTRALAGQEGTGRFGAGAKESFVGYAPVPKLGGAVIYRRPAKEALEAATGLHLRNLSISFYLVLVYLATIALAGLLARRQAQLLAANQALNEALAQRAQELARSEEALRGQTTILQSVLESMGDGVVVADENGKFLLFNPAAERIVGIGPTDATPNQWSERLWPLLG